MSDKTIPLFCLRSSLFVILASGVLCLTVAATAGEYYVSPEGHDEDPGTVTQPWKTLDKANRTLLAGDTVLIRQGVFDEIIEPFRSGMPGQLITYRNYPEEQATLRGRPNAEAIVSIGWDITGGGWEGKSYIRVEGLCLSECYHVGKVGGEYYPCHVLVYGVDSTHNEIVGCVIRRDDAIAKAREYGEIDYGIAVSKASYTLIEGNCIQGMTRIGIILGDTGRGNVVRNNRVLDCMCSSVNIGSGLDVEQETLIENNVLGGSVTEDGIQFEPDYNVSFDDGSNRGVVIRNNVIYENAENAIDLKGASHVVIEGNLIFGNRGDNEGSYEDPADRNGGLGGIMHGSSAGSKNVIVRKNVVYDNLGGIDVSPGYKVYNNVVIFNNRDYTGPDSDYGSTDQEAKESPRPIFVGIFINNDPNDVAIVNNVVGGHRGAEVLLGSEVGARVRIDYNLYFSPSDAKFAMCHALLGWQTIDFSAWKTYLQGLANVSGSDLHSRLTSPVFQEFCSRFLVSQADCAFRLREDCPAIDSGGFLTKTVSSGSGTRIEVEDAGFFFEGFGTVPGDTIQLEGRGERYRVESIDHSHNAILVDRSLTWKEGQGVALAYSGLAPDAGIWEYQEGL